MSNVNQLLAKAMSTTSEEEAMSCLRMARKKGKSLDTAESTNAYNGHNAKYWYEKAAIYYNKVKEKSDGLTIDQQKELYRMYNDVVERDSRNRTLNSKLKIEIAELKSVAKKGQWKWLVIGFEFVLIMVLLQMIG